MLRALTSPAGATWSADAVAGPATQELWSQVTSRLTTSARARVCLLRAHAPAQSHTFSLVESMHVTLFSECVHADADHQQSDLQPDRLDDGYATCVVSRLHSIYLYGALFF